MWCGPAPLKPFTADRCHVPGTYWIYDYSIGYLAGWGAHPLDIMVWGSDADIAGPTISVEGTGIIPTVGLYDTVLSWDMKIQLGDGVKMTFKAGGTAVPIRPSSSVLTVGCGFRAAISTPSRNRC